MINAFRSPIIIKRHKDYVVTEGRDGLEKGRKKTKKVSRTFDNKV